jgi:hypothetical protein
VTQMPLLDFFRPAVENFLALVRSLFYIIIN